MIGQTTGERFGLGDKVTVKLVDAAPVAGALRFEMLSDGRVDKTTTFRKPRGRRSRPRWTRRQ